MCAYYYVTRMPQKNGFHEVHIQGCGLIPDKKDARVFLGSFYTSHNAFQTAKLYYSAAKKCQRCMQ